MYWYFGFMVFRYFGPALSEARPRFNGGPASGNRNTIMPQYHHT